ncbi:MAG: hypothetical protein NZL92_10970 [Gloeomargarita sp. SKYG116]|nr:hypothetical protein [Gloeomargarita sp. SKYG116]MDW8402204.1 hypothetical protein [Gloeomargarita sp. SKYGB_i_bin116]
MEILPPSIAIIDLIVIFLSANSFANWVSISAEAKIPPPALKTILLIDKGANTEMLFLASADSSFPKKAPIDVSKTISLVACRRTLPCANALTKLVPETLRSFPGASSKRIWPSLN